MYAASRDRSIYAWNWPEPEPESEKKEDGDSMHIIPEKESVSNKLIPEPSMTLQGHSLGVTALANSEGINTDHLKYCRLTFLSF